MNSQQCPGMFFQGNSIRRQKRTRQTFVFPTYWLGTSGSDMSNINACMLKCSKQFQTSTGSLSRNGWLKGLRKRQWNRLPRPRVYRPAISERELQTDNVSRLLVVPPARSSVSETPRSQDLTVNNEGTEIELGPQ